MENNTSNVNVPKEWEKIIGIRTPGTRMYKIAGDQKAFASWFDFITSHYGACVSPGGAAARVHVSRAAVHKRLKAGKLTAFLFSPQKDNKSLPLLLRIFRPVNMPYCYIPVAECKAWGDEVLARQERMIKKQLEGTGVLPQNDADLAACKEDIPSSEDESMEFLEKQWIEVKNQGRKSTPKVRGKTK